MDLMRLIEEGFMTSHGADRYPPPALVARFSGWCSRRLYHYDRYRELPTSRFHGRFRLVLALGPSRRFFSRKATTLGRRRAGKLRRYPSRCLDTPGPSGRIHFLDGHRTVRTAQELRGGRG